MAHPAESTHWYDKDGKPAYTVKSAKGEDRPTTLRDARKLNLYPSVTTIIRLAAAPGLERWKQEQVLHAAMTLPRDPAWSEDEYISAVYKDAQEQGKKAAERGTAIHAALEGGYLKEDLPPEYEAHFHAVAEAVGIWASAHPYNATWDAERSFSHPSGFGGKTDLSCDGFVLDLKSTEKDLAAIKTWPEHAWQLSAYREGLGMPTARCAIVYVHVASAEAKVIELEQEELQQGWGCFQALLAFHQAKTGYKPC